MDVLEFKRRWALSYIDDRFFYVPLNDCSTVVGGKGRLYPYKLIFYIPSYPAYLSGGESLRQEIKSSIINGESPTIINSVVETPLYFIFDNKGQQVSQYSPGLPEGIYYIVFSRAYYGILPKDSIFSFEIKRNEKNVFFAYIPPKIAKLETELYNMTVTTKTDTYYLKHDITYDTSSPEEGYRYSVSRDYSNIQTSGKILDFAHIYVPDITAQYGQKTVSVARTMDYAYTDSFQRFNLDTDIGKQIIIENPKNWSAHTHYATFYNGLGDYRVTYNKVNHGAVVGEPITIGTFPSTVELCHSYFESQQEGISGGIISIEGQNFDCSFEGIDLNHYVTKRTFNEADKGHVSGGMNASHIYAATSFSIVNGLAQYVNYDGTWGGFSYRNRKYNDGYQFDDMAMIGHRFHRPLSKSIFDDTWETCFDAYYGDKTYEYFKPIETIADNYYSQIPQHIQNAIDSMTWHNKEDDYIAISTLLSSMVDHRRYSSSGYSLSWYNYQLENGVIIGGCSYAKDSELTYDEVLKILKTGTIKRLPTIDDEPAQFLS